MVLSVGGLASAALSAGLVSPFRPVAEPASPRFFGFHGRAGSRTGAGRPRRRAGGQGSRTRVRQRLLLRRRGLTHLDKGARLGGVLAALLSGYAYIVLHMLFPTAVASLIW